MVTKPIAVRISPRKGLILAKIHMVTKHSQTKFLLFCCLILAKIHMVTKPKAKYGLSFDRLILAKIHMVTKRTSSWS